MTIWAWGRPRRFPRLPQPEARLFRVAADAQVLGHCHWQVDRARHPLIVALHGLEGSSGAHYMCGLAEKGYAAGFSVIRLNQRNCGGTEQLSAGLYHSGLSADVDRVIQEVTDADGIRNVVVAGYSLGGNLALKLAGDYGESPPSALRGVCAVSPVIDLEGCVRALEKPENFGYQWNFIRGLKGRMRRKASCFPGRFPLEPLDRIRTVREFDDAYTAPYFGFHGASDYYYRASAMRVIDRIRVPGLIITAKDDPFVPTAPFRDPLVTSNPHLRVIVTGRGGHCAFLADPLNGNDGYWAETTITEFAKEVVASAAEPTPARAPALRV